MSHAYNKAKKARHKQRGKSAGPHHVVSTRRLFKPIEAEPMPSPTGTPQGPATESVFEAMRKLTGIGGW